MTCIVYQKQIGGKFQAYKKMPFHLHQFVYLHGSGILSFYRLIVGSKESSVTKIITDATAGSDYDQVYKHNFDEDFSITPNKIERMEKLMTEHHATLLRTVASTTKHQLYQSCQVGNIGPNDTKSL